MRTVVIGAGVLGASAAYHLARAGAQVTVIDADLLGRATAADAGIVCPWVTGVDDPVFYRLYTEAARYYAELLPALGGIGEHDLGFRQVGGMAASASAVDLLRLERVVRWRHAAAPEMGAVSQLTPREAQALFPPLHADLGAMHVAGGARVDGRRLAAALLRAARHHGAVVRDGEAALIATAGRAVGVRQGSERLEADQVVVTTGARAPALLRELGIDLPIRPQRGQITHLRLPGQATQGLAGHPADRRRPLPAGVRRPPRGGGRNAGARGRVRLPRHGGRAGRGAGEHAGRGTRLGRGRSDRARVGFRPMGPEIWPLLGAASVVPGLVSGNGLGAAGLTIDPFAGRLLADVALGRPPALDLAPFDPLRMPTPARDVPPTLR